MVRNPRWTLTQEATLALAISAAFPASAFAAEVARVQFAAGQASATTADGRVRTLARGADINEGDTVNTEQGRVQLKFRDGALVSLQPRTAFRIDEYAYRGTADGSEKGFFSLLRGGLRTITGVIGRSNSDSYRVRTQTATIGIRGTEYIAQVGNSLNVSVGGGRIALTNDAGTFIIDRRCCSVAFQIPAEEPEEATGVVRASFDGLREGLPLTRTDAGWSASFCMPLNSVIAYRYEFTFLFDAGDSWTADDAGVDEDAGADVDGGEAFADAGSDAGPVLTTVARASPHGYSTNDGQGGMVNIYQVAEDCGAADASVSLRP